MEVNLLVGQEWALLRSCGGGWWLLNEWKSTHNTIMDRLTMPNAVTFKLFVPITWILSKAHGMFCGLHNKPPPTTTTTAFAIIL